MKPEFMQPVYANVGVVEPPRVPTAITIERAAELLRLDFENVMKLVAEGRLRVIPKQLPEAATMTLFVEGQGVVEMVLAREKRGES